MSFRGYLFRMASAWLMCLSCFGQGVITTIAGNGRIFRGDGGPALSANLGEVSAVTLDRAGNVYASSFADHIVVKIAPNGILTVVAGNGLAGYSGDGGPATAASLDGPLGIRLDRLGNLYIAESGRGGRIRKVAPDGMIGTVAGPAITNTPLDVMVDGANNILFSSLGSHGIRRISPDGTVTTIAGNGVPGFSGDGGPATQAQLSSPTGIEIDSSGNLYIADTLNNRVRRVSPDGIITTVAGSGSNLETAEETAIDGVPALSANISRPGYLSLDSDGSLYVANSRVRRIRDGIVTVVAGLGSDPGDGGPVRNALLLDARSVAAVDRILYIGEAVGARVRRVGLDGVINTIAGAGPQNFSGDFGPAVNASLARPAAVALDRAGSLYIADSQNHRIRRLASDGTISTIAGRGTRGFSEGGSVAVNALFNDPSGVAVDDAGNLIVADLRNDRIRRITPAGAISTIAGTGTYGHSGDGGPATGARLAQPNDVAIDSAGNIYFSEGGNRVRKITPAGVISTLAGNGVTGFSGDGGPAAAAILSGPSGIAVDSQGRVYITDSFNRRIRRISPDGIIQTVAGGGSLPPADGRLATEVSLPTIGKVRVDAAGNFYFGIVHRVARVSSEGILTFVVGSGPGGFAGDGGPAASAQFFGPQSPILDSGGNLFIADSGNDRVRKVLTARPTFSVEPPSLTFSAPAGASDVFPRTVAVLSPVSGLAIQVTATGGEWLNVSPRTGSTPSVATVSVNTVGLAPGVYRGTLVFAAPEADPAVRTVSVELIVGAEVAPRLSVESAGLSFALNTGSVPGTGRLAVRNSGGGTLDFRLATTTSSGGSWLSATPAAGGASSAQPGAVTVTANPAGLDAGTYTGQIQITSPATGQTATVPVTMAVTGVTQTILLSQTGLTFTAVANGGPVPPQTFGVLNTRQGIMSWSVETLTLSGGADWLSATPATGSSEGGSLFVPLVEVSVRHASLAPGEYYGQVRVFSRGADNSPQLVSVVLQVLPPGANPGPLVRPTGLIFTSVAGTTSPGSQQVLVSNLTATPVTFRSGRVTVDGLDWFVSVPPSETIVPGQPTRLTVQTDTSILTPGIRSGVLTLAFSDLTNQTVNLLSVLLPSGESRTGRAADGCTPRSLLPVFTTIRQNFAVRVGWPSTIGARIVDDCGQPMIDGGVVASFSNGDPPVSLVRLGDGNWSATWQPRSVAAGGVTVTLSARNPALQIEGTTQTTGGLLANPNVPLVNQAALVNAASFGPLALVSPGSMISIFGSRLADRETFAPALPLPAQLGGVSVSMGGQALPLLYVSDGQVNAVVPYDATTNSQLQVVVRRGTSYSVPEPVTVAATRPGIFSRDGTGQGQGLIFKAGALADASNPAQASDVVVVYATGLGEVNPSIAAGAAAPGAPLARVVSPVDARVGGLPAPVTFAGLAPGFAGLYQVNVQIPAGVGPGASVSLALSQSGVSSNTVTLSMR